MRRGYWRTLLRCLRLKLDAGENTLIHQNGVFVIGVVCAEEEVAPDGDSEVRLAEDAQGNWMVLDASAAHIMLVDRENGERVQVDLDLAALVQGLCLPA